MKLKAKCIRFKDTPQHLLRVFGRGKKRQNMFQKALEDYRKSVKVFVSSLKILKTSEKFYDL